LRVRSFLNKLSDENTLTASFEKVRTMTLCSPKLIVCWLAALVLVAAAHDSALAQATKKKPAEKKAVNKAPKKTPSEEGSGSEGATSGSTTVSPSELKLSVVGLTIGKEIPKPEEEDSSKKPSFGGGFGMMGVQPGTSLSIHFAGNRDFVRLDDEKSKIISFADDKGTDLLSKSDKSKSKPGAVQFSFTPRLRADFAEDRHAGLIHATAPQRPVAGATKITLKADVVIKCGTGEKTAEQADIKFEKGTKITAGPVPMTIEQVEPSSFNDDYKMTVTLQAKAKLDSIKKIAFFDASGKEIKSTKGGESSFTFAGSTQVDRGYMLAEKVDSATIKITYFEKLEDVVVPVEITTGVGF
jgi:hypothetical protein